MAPIGSRAIGICTGSDGEFEAKKLLVNLAESARDGDHLRCVCSSNLQVEIKCSHWRFNGKWNDLRRLDFPKIRKEGGRSFAMMNEDKAAAAVETGAKPKSKTAPDAIAEEGEDGVGGVGGGGGVKSANSLKKRFENAIRKNKIIATIQQLGEEKDVAGDESQLEKAGRSIRSFRKELISIAILQIPPHRG